MPSAQLVHYLTLRGEGCSVATAADESGIGEAEAWLHEEDVKAGTLEFITPSRARTCAPARVEDQHEGEKIMTSAAVRTNADGDVESAALLKNFIERVERLHKERDDLGSDLKDVFAEAKSHGFDTNIMKTVIKRRKMGMDAAHEADALLEAYENAVQHQLPLPLQAEIRTPKRHLEPVN